MHYDHTVHVSGDLRLWLHSPGVSNLSAMAGRIDFILGVAGHYAISAAVNAMFECEL